ncbi:orcokinin peptides type A [Trichinella spiralis]|uniref:orcokinin peptides type A n=1 Tax=Trichinella spiralis TaxID=6334 RepID=UPI0001EFD521|nr:orcokinin peptides type A [Trichinella spiralis]
MYRALGGKKNFNQFDVGLSGFSKRPFDRLEGAHFSGFDKRTLDMLEGSSMSGFNKRYFDVPRLYIKRNFDKFDSATLSGFRRKRMLDNIDSAGFAFSNKTLLYQQLHFTFRSLSWYEIINCYINLSSIILMRSIALA